MGGGELSSTVDLWVESPLRHKNFLARLPQVQHKEFIVLDPGPRIAALALLLSEQSGTNILPVVQFSPSVKHLRTFVLHIEHAELGISWVIINEWL